MRRYASVVALLTAVVLVAGSLAAEEPKKALTTKDIGKMMKAAHHGDKSPQARAAAELKKDSPDWQQLAKDAKSFSEMGAAFKGVDLRYASPAKYIESSTAFTKATGDKDKKAASDAFTALSKSCVACHSYGGPGGAIK